MQQLFSDWWIALMFAAIIFTLLSIIHLIDKHRLGEKTLHTVIIIGTYGSGTRKMHVPP